MDRAREAADHALSAVRGDSRETLEAPIDAALTAVAARVEKMRAEFEAMSKAYDAAAARMEALDAQARALDDAATEAIHIYRQENTAARATPAPSYFNTTPPTAGPSLDALATCGQMIDGARAQLAESKQQSTRALEELVAELDETTKRLLQIARDHKVAVVGVTETMPAGTATQAWFDGQLGQVDLALSGLTQ